MKASDSVRERHLMRSRLSVPIPWQQVFSRTVRKIDHDDCLGLAAQLSFYFLLGLFPALLFLVSLVGLLPLEAAFAELLTALSTVAPGQLVQLLGDQVEQLETGSHAGVLTLGFVGAIWSSSAAMVAIIDALNRAFDVGERRPWWRRRLVAIALTITLATFIVVSMTLVFVGPSVALRIANWLGGGSLAAWVWSLLRWPVMIGGVMLGVDLVYYFAPNRRTRWIWITPGAVVATTLWIVASFVFKFYVTNIGDHTATYGAIGGAIIAMLWFYVSSLAILVGAELNGVIEGAWQSTRRR